MGEEPTKRYAVVTGANKGIGFEICRQLASNGIVVVLTARDEKRGLEALQKLQDSGLSDYVLFHQLDVADTASIAALADFIKTQFGKLDILVNNAGVGGVILDGDALRASDFGKEGVNVFSLDWDKIIASQTSELAEECIAINYYGAKRTAEALIPLLQLSDSPRIVNVSSMGGALKNIQNEWAKEVLGDADNLSEERIDEVLNKYLNDFKESSPETKGWPEFFSAYELSKAALNAYTRILAKKLPSFRINSVCPGLVKTDLIFNMGKLSPAEGAESAVRLALLPNDGPSGCLFDRKDESPF
ncbi:hypothetical protein JCGZ_14432 [Jatropha curcas]|uniref:Short-chain dehydrogenase/reductase n=1 Tax=Jatropha curcas TaxID=180498 RepID=A0A067JXG7_JATCU|nr:(+)-neomenthol dehydrogenase [Jatropha curcas]KDP28661.1 hypothetical protein JCGZ_14432 [Jatropha curcas]